MRFILFILFPFLLQAQSPVKINGIGQTVSINGAGQTLSINAASEPDPEPPGEDADAQAFITATGISDATLEAALVDMVIDLKAADQWNNIYAFYPFVGGTATTNKYNLKNPLDTDAAFRITFSGTVTHDNEGITGDGSTGYGDTHFTPSTDYTKDNTGIIVATLDDVRNSGYVDIGARTASTQAVYINTGASGSSIGRMYNESSLVTANQPNSTSFSSKGLFALSRTSATSLKFYKNAKLLDTETASSTSDALTTKSLTILANNAATVQNFSARTMALLLITDGLTDDDISEITPILERFLKAAGKQPKVNRDILALGDSFTAGSLASVADSQFINRLGNLYSQAIENRGAGGEGAYKVCDNFFSSLVNGNRSGYYTFAMFGFNDLRRGGDNAKTYNKLKAATRTIIANQFAKKVISVQDASVTKTNWSTDQSGVETSRFKYATSPLNPLSSSAIDATLEWTFTGNNVFVGAYITQSGLKDSINGPFEIYIDDVLQGSYDLRDMSDGIASNSNPNKTIPYAIFINGLSSGSHTIKIKATTAIPSTIDYFGIMYDAEDCAGLIFGDIAYMTEAGYSTGTSTNNASTLIMQNGTDAIHSVIDLFPGYPIYKSPTNDFYNLTTDVDADNVHPNDSGHDHIFDAIQSVINP